MRKIIALFFIMMFTTTTAMAAKIPDGVKNIIKKDFAKADFRFDGLITLPDGTLYLPLYPALIKNLEKLTIKTTYPANTPLAKKPDIVILNNDFTLLKIIDDAKGRKSVILLDNPPIEVKTGLLPQDLLVPKGLIIPDNIKGIIGNLQIATAQDAGLRVKAEPVGNLIKEAPKTSTNNANLPQLTNKIIYAITCYSKNIHVIKGESRAPEYAFTQKAIPIDIKAYDKFLVVTSYDKKTVDIISLADERIIREIELDAQPDDIVMDYKNQIAYIACPEGSAIFKLDLKTMTLKQKIKVSGMCEHLTISDDNNKLIYVDKKSNEVYAIELDNEFTIRDVGSFPNISKIAYTQNKIYLTSRTKSKLAIIDYLTLSLITEIKMPTKPVDMLVYKNKLFILSAQDTAVTVLKTDTDEIEKTIYLNTKGFSTKINKLENQNYAIITDTLAGKYSIIDLDKKVLIKNNNMDIPISKMVITNNVKKISK